MCGIAGIISEKKINWEFDKLLKIIDHRGPDKTGIYYWKNNLNNLSVDNDSYNLVLGHKRLSILDLSEAGSQPFYSINRDKVLCYNGEVYNYLELKFELEKLGAKFLTNTDTEVVLLAIEMWGVEQALKKFQGMFAFALFDVNKKEITLARDAFGIKPLYFTYINDVFAFSSEIKFLKQLPGLENKLNVQMASEYLFNGSCDFGDKTLFSNIYQFPQASWQTFSVENLPCKLNFNIFWNPEDIFKKDISYEKAVKLVREKFLKNVEQHLRSDVPFGVALSGGLDSSAIACCIRYLYPDISINTFSYVSSDNNISEEKWVDIVNTHINAISHKIVIKEDDILKDYDKLMDHQDEPFVSLAIYSQYRVFEKAKEEGVLVMLDGQGSDELMGGYSPLQGVRLASLIKSRKFYSAARFLLSQNYWQDRTTKDVFFTSINQLLSSAKYNKLRNFVRKPIQMDWINMDYFTSKGVSNINNHYLCEGPEYLRDVLKRSLKNGLLSLLRYEDRNSMAHSIESRVPFLTTEFAEIVLSLPEEYLIDIKGTSKAVFRDAMRGIVPDEILDRKEKKGFATPDVLWLRANNKFIMNLIENSENINCLKFDIVKSKINSAIKNENDYSSMVWRVINFIDWFNRNNIEND